MFGVTHCGHNRDLLLFQPRDKRLITHILSTTAHTGNEHVVNSLVIDVNHA